MVQTLRTMWQRFRDGAKKWIQVYGRRGIASLGLISTIALAFEGGFLMGRDRQVSPILVEKPAKSCLSSSSGSVIREEHAPANTVPEASTEKVADSPAVAAPKTGDSTCAFVGSRNSNKYHVPTCSWAKRIKPENRVCFASAADAEARGYQPGCVK